MVSKLDQVVKGAAPPGTSLNPSSRSPSPASDAEDRVPSIPHVSDPLSILPSSPPQIYLNLLILEASLRSQYLLLRARRKQNTFFLFLLGLWNTFFFYALFLQPREDGSGIGGSVYWVVETTEKVALMGGVVTGILVWGTGQWERGVRWPRRFVGVTNRGLRTMNCKIIVLKGPWWKELLGHFSFLFPYSLFHPSPGSAYHFVDASQEKRAQHQIAKHGLDDELDLVREEDLAPGGDFIKLLLLPKPFSPDFRENWELYRSEYWEKENGRRAALLRQLKVQERQRARGEGGWLWWLGLWSHKNRGWNRDGDVEKLPPRHHSGRDSKRLSVRRGESHSRTASRSSTSGSVDTDERPSSRSSRRSSMGGPSEGRRKARGSSSSNSHLSAKSPAAHTRPNLTALTPNRSPLTRSSSSFGTSSGNESG